MENYNAFVFLIGLVVGILICGVILFSGISQWQLGPPLSAKTYCMKVIGGETTTKTTDNSYLCLIPSGYAKEFIMLEGTGYEVK